ncbi:hypothetical protein HK102_002977 [Quaeritorhiza haematococci]|nr:hypothetical protein HK102_002977 [Quaeritorhiza haematococci]
MTTVITEEVVKFLIEQVFAMACQLITTVGALHTKPRNQPFFVERLKFIQSLQPAMKSLCSTKESKDKAHILSLLHTKLLALDDLLKETANVFGRIENKRTKFIKMFAKAVTPKDIEADVEQYTKAFDSTMTDICVVLQLQQAVQHQQTSLDLSDVKEILSEAREERKKTNNPINIDQITTDMIDLFKDDRDYGIQQALLQGNIQRIFESDIELGNHLTDGRAYSIFLCTLRNKEDCVVKTPTSSKVIAPSDVSDLLREAKILQHLQGQPYVVGFKGFALLDNRPSIVLERCTEGTIHEFIERTVAVSWDVKLTLMQQLAFALEYIHSMGTCHGDLRPCNVLVTKVDNRPEIRLIDFNHSSSTAVKTIAKKHNKRSAHGWDLYMPPETRQVGALGIRSDVYQAGLLFWEIACWTRRQNTEEYIPPSIPDEIKELIKGCTQRYQEDRIDMIKASALIGRAGVLGKYLRLQNPNVNDHQSMRSFFLECSSYANEYDGDVLEMVAVGTLNGDGTEKNEGRGVAILEYLANMGYPKAAKTLREYFKAKGDMQRSLQWGNRYNDLKRDMVRFYRKQSA